MCSAFNPLSRVSPSRLFSYCNVTISPPKKKQDIIEKQDQIFQIRQNISPFRLTQRSNSSIAQYRVSSLNKSVPVIFRRPSSGIKYSQIGQQQYDKLSSRRQSNKDTAPQFLNIILQNASSNLKDNNKLKTITSIEKSVENNKDQNYNFQNNHNYDWNKYNNPNNNYHHQAPRRSLSNSSQKSSRAAHLSATKQINMSLNQNTTFLPERGHTSLGYTCPPFKGWVEHTKSRDSPPRKPNIYQEVIKQRDFSLIYKTPSISQNYLKINKIRRQTVPHLPTSNSENTPVTQELQEKVQNATYGENEHHQIDETQVLLNNQQIYEIPTVEELERIKSLPKEEQMLIKYEKLLFDQIQQIKHNQSAAQHVKMMIEEQESKYAALGDENMARLFKGMIISDEELIQMNQEHEKEQIQLFEQINKNNEDSNISNQLQSQSASDQTQAPQKPYYYQKQKLKQQKEYNEKEKLKQEIDSTIRKVQKYLELSINQSHASTIEMNQTQVISKNEFQPSDIFLREVSYLHRTINLISCSRQCFTVDIFLCTLETLPFDFKSVQADPEKAFLGEGTFGKVYRISTGNKLSASDKENEENNLWAVKVVRCNNMKDLERKAGEIVIQKYLAQKHFMHICTLKTPAYFISKQDHFQLLFLTEIGAFSLAQVLQKRCQKSQPYTEGQLLHLFKAFIVILKELHNLKVAHRDIKPENLVFNKKDSSWKLIDYGVAKMENDLNTPKEYNICGTRLYAIPKIQDMRYMKDLRGKLKMSLKANDYYALGITLFRIKFLQIHPFDGKILRQMLSSIQPFGNEQDLSTKILSVLTDKEESQRIQVNLDDLIKEIESQIEHQVFPNDYAFMNDIFHDLHLYQDCTSKLQTDQDLFQKALTFKKLKQNDHALNLFDYLQKKQDAPLKLRANCLSSIAQIYHLQGNYIDALKVLDLARKSYLEIYPKDSVKHGEIYEELGNLFLMMNQTDLCIEFSVQAYSIYQKNSFDRDYRCKNLNDRLSAQGINIQFEKELKKQMRFSILENNFQIPSLLASQRSSVTSDDYRF